MLSFKAWGVDTTRQWFNQKKHSFCCCLCFTKRRNKITLTSDPPAAPPSPVLTVVVVLLVPSGSTTVSVTMVLYPPGPRSSFTSLLTVRDWVVVVEDGEVYVRTYSGVWVTWADFVGVSSFLSLLNKDFKPPPPLLEDGDASPPGIEQMKCYIRIDIGWKKVVPWTGFCVVFQNYKRGITQFNFYIQQEIIQLVVINKMWKDEYHAVLCRLNRLVFLWIDLEITH